MLEALHRCFSEAKLEVAQAISNATARADEAIWEAQCSVDEAVMVAGIKISVTTTYVETVIC